MTDIDKALEDVRQCRYLPEREFIILCEEVRQALFEENNVIQVQSPVTICGDIHGQLFDLLRLFEIGGDVGDTRYIFMGDYVDRGYYSLETFTLLMLLKLKYPDRIFLLRGNHESRQITQIYGFYEECYNKYGNANPWRYCTQIFDFLTLSALVDGRVLCVHGGLSPHIRIVDQIRAQSRLEELMQIPGFSDLMWSDPSDEIESWRKSPRGAGWLFGKKVVNDFTLLNGLDLVCRSHQVIQEGYKYSFTEESLVTVWSAPNYFYRIGNKAAIMELDSDLNRKFVIFDAVENDKRKVPLSFIVPMFL